MIVDPPRGWTGAILGDAAIGCRWRLSGLRIVGLRAKPPQPRIPFGSCPGGFVDDSAREHRPRPELSAAKDTEGDGEDRADGREDLLTAAAACEPCEADQTERAGYEQPEAGEVSTRGQAWRMGVAARRMPSGSSPWRRSTRRRSHRARRWRPLGCSTRRRARRAGWGTIGVARSRPPPRRWRTPARRPSATTHRAVPRCRTGCAFAECRPPRFQRGSRMPGARVEHLRRRGGWHPRPSVLPPVRAPWWSRLRRARRSRARRPSGASRDRKCLPSPPARSVPTPRRRRLPASSPAGFAVR